MGQQRRIALERELKILVVDGLTEAVSSLTAMLQELGFADVQSATDGTEALQRVQRGEVELLIADWSVPELTGIELLKTLRADQRFADLPIVMTACQEEREHLVEAICEGASNLLVLSDDKQSMLESLRLRLETIFDVDPFSERASSKIS